MEAWGGNVLAGRWAACTCESKVAAVGVLSLMSGGKTAFFVASLDNVKELRFDPNVELTPSESSSSSSSDLPSPALPCSCSLARRAALMEFWAALLLDF